MYSFTGTISGCKQHCNTIEITDGRYTVIYGTQTTAKGQGSKILKSRALCCIIHRSEVSSLDLDSRSPSRRRCSYGIPVRVQ